MTRETRQDIRLHERYPLDLQSSGPARWMQVAGERQSVVRHDTLPNSWLSLNFKVCDTNHDGRVTRAEYRVCRRLH